MTVNMTMSLPDDVAAYVRAQGNASAYTTRVLRRQMLRDALEARRAYSGAPLEVGEPGEGEEETLARWVRVAGR